MLLVYPKNTVAVARDHLTVAKRVSWVMLRQFRNISDVVDSAVLLFWSRVQWEQTIYTGLLFISVGAWPFLGNKRLVLSQFCSGHFW